MVCSKQLFRKPWDTVLTSRAMEIREINEIMNNSVTGRRVFLIPVLSQPYGRQKGWERIQPDNRGGDFQELTSEEVEQLELPQSG